MTTKVTSIHNHHPGYRPGKVGDAIRRCKSGSVTLHKPLKQNLHRKPKYGEQLPFPGQDTQLNIAEPGIS